MIITTTLTPASASALTGTEIVALATVLSQPGPPGPAGAGTALTDTDTIETRLAGDAHPLANLRKADGSALANPFTVAQAGGADSWQVLLPTSRPVDAYHVEGAAYLADLSRLRPAAVLHFSTEPTSPPEPWLYDVRVFGAITSPVTATIQLDGSIEFTFSEAVTGVTCSGDGTGTLEATDGTSFAPSVSGTGAVYTLAPPVAGWVEAATITLTGKTTIAAAADATKLYDGLGFLLSVAVSAPDVTAPVMTSFVVEATSADANIAITALTATDDIGVTGYQVNTSATAPNPATGTWQSAAAWIASGYDSGLGAGQTQTITLYAWAKDAAGNVSLSLTDSCDVSTPAHAPSFSVQPTLNTAKYDGGTFNFTLADDSGHNLDVQAWNGSTWSAALTNVAAGAKTAVPITGLAAGTISGLKFRVADTGTSSWVESSVIADFNTVAPALSSVVNGDTQTTSTFANHPNDTADSFNLLWGTTSGQLVNTIVGATSPHVHTGRTNGQAYYYAVVAIKGGITSSQSAEMSNLSAYLDAFDNSALNTTKFGTVTASPGVVTETTSLVINSPTSAAASAAWVKGFSANTYGRYTVDFVMTQSTRDLFGLIQRATNPVSGTSGTLAAQRRIQAAINNSATILSLTITDQAGTTDTTEVTLVTGTTYRCVIDITAAGVQISVENLAGDVLGSRSRVARGVGLKDDGNPYYLVFGMDFYTDVHSGSTTFKRYSENLY